MSRKSNDYKELQQEIETDYILDDFSEEEEFKNELEHDFYSYEISGEE